MSATADRADIEPATDDCLPGFLEDQIQRAGLAPIYEKVLAGERLTHADGIALFETRELNLVGAMANIVRERKNGNVAYFNRNLHINYTNICNKQCLFCAFDR